MHWLTLANTVTGLLLLGKGAASVIKSADTRPRLGRAYNGVLDGGDLSSFSLSRRQGSSPQCGAAANGARCTNNLCCSQWGYCGSSDIYCSNISGCQPAYGVCEGSSTTTSATSTTTSTTTTSSSSSSTVTTTTSSSSTSTSSSSSSSSSSTASPTVVLPPGQSTTTDGTCGNNKSCLGWAYGQCCSQFGYCGSGDAYCSEISGCQPSYGLCEGSSSSTTPGVPTSTSSSTSSSSTSSVTTTTSSVTTTSSTSSSASASPTVTLPPGQSTTTDGTCGNNKSCLGWTYGQCCSQYGYCGSGSTYCSPLAQCQPNYGLCDAA